MIKQDAPKQIHLCFKKLTLWNLLGLTASFLLTFGISLGLTFKNALILSSKKPVLTNIFNKY